MLDAEDHFATRWEPLTDKDAWARRAAAARLAELTRAGNPDDATQNKRLQVRLDDIKAGRPG